MPVLRRHGCDLHYEEHGTGTAILGVHGSPSAAAFWSEPAAALGHLGRCVVYDRRGYGRSVCDEVPVQIDLSDQLEDALALLVELAAAPAVVIGRSTGGLIALALALRHPSAVRAMVLLEPAVFSLDPTSQAWADGVREAVLAAAARDPSKAAQAVFAQVLAEDAWSAFPQEARDLFTQGSAALLAEVHGQGLDLSEEPFHPTAEQLAGLVQPTLVVSGEDSYVAARAVDDRLVALLPAVRHVVVPGGHIVDPASPAVLGFVAEVLSDS